MNMLSGMTIMAFIAINAGLLAGRVAFAAAGFAAKKHTWLAVSLLIVAVAGAFATAFFNVAVTITALQENNVALATLGIIVSLSVITPMVARQFSRNRNH